MAEKTSINKSFYGQLTIIATIVVCSITGFNYLEIKVNAMIEAKIASIFERVKTQEDALQKTTELLSVNTEDVGACIVSIENFLTYYNKKYNKEFIVPSQITINDLEVARRKHKNPSN